jgi:predicted nucleic acid-binding protein
MIVVDTSAFISSALGDVLEPVLTEYDVHTTAQVVRELEETAEYDDVHGTAAERVLGERQAVTVQNVTDPGIRTARVDDGEASCVAVAQQDGADFLVTDDLRALPELQQLTDARVAISPILLRALVKRGVLTDEQAAERLEDIAASRDWLGAPIYRRAQELFHANRDE